MLVRCTDVKPLKPGSPPDDVMHAAFDARARTARRAVCAAITSVLAEASSRLRAAGHAWGNDGIEALGLMASIAAELSGSATRCLDQSACYASAALVRQIAEVQYFMWAFAQSRDASRDWLQASPAIIRQNFRPAALRKKGQSVFDDEEYWRHCDMAGHPNPAAHVLFGQDADQSIVVELAFADLAQHLERVWQFFLTALQLRNLPPPLEGESHETTMNAILDWHAVDPLSSSLRTQAEPSTGT